MSHLGVGDTGNAPIGKRLQELSFTVQSIDCIACSLIFRRHIGKIGGVKEIKELPITNKIIVVFDYTQIDEQTLKQEINKISEKAGFGGKLIFHRR